MGLNMKFYKIRNSSGEYYRVGYPRWTSFDSSKTYSYKHIRAGYSNALRYDRNIVICEYNVDSENVVSYASFSAKKNIPTKVDLQNLIQSLEIEINNKLETLNNLKQELNLRFQNEL